ncbi:MAG: alpha/beta fold hydrolase [Acidobacteriota bacterium]
MRTLIIGIVLFLTGCGAAGTGNHANSGNTANPGATPPVESAASAVTEVVINSPDGVQLAGTFFDSGKPGSPALLLLHQWQDDRHAFDEFAKRMQGKGFSVLSIDGRGFGGSTKTADGKTVKTERSGEAVNAMLGDVNAAIEFLSKSKNVDPSKIGIVGASYGSSLALIYAADHPNVAAVALLSPGLNYFGNMPTEPAIKKYGDRPMILLASTGDKESADAVNKLLAAGNNVRYGANVFSASGHGTELFKYRATQDGPPVAADMIEAFFTDRLFQQAGIMSN